jgi:hypothetical protein
MKPKIFIASPLFNPEQIEIITQIEDLLRIHGYDFYSARLHSGSDKMSPEQRKDIRSWDPVFESNIRGLDECRVMIAVLEYAMPKNRAISVLELDTDNTDESNPYGFGVRKYTPIELPDSGLRRYGSWV